jgi:hypothetical protein
LCGGVNSGALQAAFALGRWWQLDREVDLVPAGLSGRVASAEHEQHGDQHEVKRQETMTSQRRYRDTRELGGDF